LGAKTEIPADVPGDVKSRELNAGIEKLCASGLGRILSGGCGMKWSRLIAFQTMVVPLVLLGTVLLQLGSGSANANTGLTLDKKLSARDLIAQYGLNENTQILNQRVEAAGRVAAQRGYGRQSALDSTRSAARGQHDTTLSQLGSGNFMIVACSQGGTHDIEFEVDEQAAGRALVGESLSDVEGCKSVSVTERQLTDVRYKVSIKDCTQMKCMYRIKGYMR
jgi:hypothetical protein